MGNLNLRKMKYLIVALLFSLCVTTALSTTNCLATKYCQGCDTTNGNCNYCSGDVNFNAGGTKGARVLSNGSCVAMTSANKPTVGAEHVAFYDTDVRATASFTTSKKFFCKTGYYAYIDETNTALSGCYASSTSTSAPLSTCTGTPTTANGNYVACGKTTNGSSWYLYDCHTGKISDTEANDGKNCSGTNTVTNCNAGEWESGSKGCRTCNTGFTKASTNLTCITNTTALANCRIANTAGTACAYCDHLSYFNGSGVCIKGAFLKTVSVMLLSLLALILNGGL